MGITNIAAILIVLMLLGMLSFETAVVLGLVFWIAGRFVPTDDDDKNERN